LAVHPIVALCQARSSTKPLWGFTSRNPYHSQSRAEQAFTARITIISIKNKRNF